MVVLAVGVRACGGVFAYAQATAERGLVGVAPGSEEERSCVRPKVEWTAETGEVACVRHRGRM